jgi:hypothetical protein
LALIVMPEAADSPSSQSESGSPFWAADLHATISPDRTRPPLALAGAHPRGRIFVGMILHVLYAELDGTLARVANFLSDPMRPIEPTLRAMIMTAPHIGERSKAILAKIGLEKDEIDRLVAEKRAFDRAPVTLREGRPSPGAPRANRRGRNKTFRR